MRLGLLTAALGLTLTQLAHAQDAGDCFSPTQHTDWVFQADAGPGCPCDSAIDVDVVCVNEVPVACREDRWTALWNEEGHGCGAFYTPPFDPEPASWCAMSPGRKGRGSGALIGLLAGMWSLRRRGKRR